MLAYAYGNCATPRDTGVILAYLDYKNYLLNGSIGTMWQDTNNGLYKKFEFKNFDEAFSFMQKVAEIARNRNHHPKWQNQWNIVEIWLATHESDNQITEQDRQMADAVDSLLNESKGERQESKAAPKVARAKMFADGGSRGNPGPSASGFVLMTPDDQEIIKNGEYLGITTNNQAEYQALKLGVEYALKYGVRELEVYMDSLLVINQMKGIFKVKNRDLWPIHQAIKELCVGFDKVHFAHVPRELNKIADGEVNRVLDEVSSK
jgi:ribonuclease HI/pterin-4a-carbinolamine dehydratase